MIPYGNVQSSEYARGPDDEQYDEELDSDDPYDEDFDTVVRKGQGREGRDSDEDDDDDEEKKVS